jgi:hypothetical protein
MNQHFTPPSLKPDLKQATEFIDRLTGEPDSIVCFQVFPEAPDAKGFAWHEHGTLQELSPKLILAQKRGCGVFIVINETDGKGRRAANIKHARSAFVDLDTSELPTSFPLPPQMIVQTSPGRHHVYWLSEPLSDIPLIAVVQKRLATYYGGDTKVCDPSHVMRLPGFWHLKADPFLVHISQGCSEDDAATDGFGRYLFEELEKHHSCQFDLPSTDFGTQRLDAPPTGWDHEADVRRALWYLENDAQPAIQGSGGDETTYYVACTMRDLGISESLAIDMMIESYNPRCIPPWDHEDVTRKVQNAYAYATGDAGSRSIGMDFLEVDPGWIGDATPDDDSWMDGDASQGPVSTFEQLSLRYCTVVDGTFRVMYLDENPEMPGRRVWQSMSEQAFRSHFSNQKIEADNKLVPLGKAWLESPDRPSAIGLTFDASASPADNINARIMNGRLNLWTGFGVAPVPKAGGWKLLEAMIRDDLCVGNEILFSYLLKWIAYKIQNPGLPSETSIVFRGPKGVGKTTLGEILVDIFGSHGLVVSRRSQFAGQFSGHLATACFVFADEAVWGGNKEDEGTLKKLITDRHVLYRAMYKEEAYGVNRVGLMMATNEDWAAPATFEERRFVVLEVSGKHRVTGPHDVVNRSYWDALHAEIQSGGREAFFYDMQNMALSDWTPKLGAPKTEALGSQILEGLRGIDRWYYEILTEGVLPHPPHREEPAWEQSGHFVAYDVLLRDCRDWMRRNRQQAAITPRALAKKLEPFGWKRGRTSGAKGLLAPSRADAIAAFERRLGCKIFD